jgi:hypothetical protein
LLAGQKKAGLFVVFDEVANHLIRGPQENLNLSSRTIPDADPNDLWGVAIKDTSFGKIRVLRHDREAVRFGMVPDGIVFLTPKTATMYVF